jgi:hypothetical protein
MRSPVRALCWALLCLVVPAMAHAGWETKEIKWRISSVGSPTNPTAIYVRDTTVTSIGPVDTTASFSLDDAGVMPRGLLAPGIVGLAALWAHQSTQNDTTIIGYIVLCPDSSAVPTPAFTGVTALIDGRLGGFGASGTVVNSIGWVKADSALANGAAGGGMILGDHTITFPIRTMSPYGGIFRFAELRARITGVGGATGLAAARVFLRYYKP